jgi:NitT/TauT family transport system substrate-binding protein
MERHIPRARAALLAAGLLALASIGGAAAQTPAPSIPSGNAGDATDKDFIVAFTSIGLSSTPLLAAIDDLRSQGYTIETPEIADNALIVAGVAENDFQFSSGTTVAVLIANQQGAPLNIIGDRVSNEWTLVSTADIADCNGLNNARLAQHSEGAVSTAMVRNWIETTCGAVPQELIIAGSDNRANALRAGEIDASPLELSDAISLTTGEGGEAWHILASFSDGLPDLKPSTIYGNSDFLAAYPAAAEALLTAQLKQHQMIADDPAYLKSLVEKYVPGFNPDTIDTVTQEYVTRGLFDTAGGLTPENLAGTIQFFTDAGSIEAGLTPEQVGNFTYLEAAKAAVGGSMESPGATAAP